MPFDATDFPPRPRKQRSSSNDNAATLIIIATAAMLLLTPISAAALVDIIHYLQRHETGKARTKIPPATCFGADRGAPDGTNACGATASAR